MKNNLPREDVYESKNPVGYGYMEMAVDPLVDSARRVRRFAPARCREMTIAALETYVRFAVGDDARRLTVTLRHLRGELPAVPLSFSL